jgi:integrase
MKLIMEQFRDDYYSSFGEKYENHVNKFIEYLRRIDKLDTPTKVDLIDVKNCVKYYSEIGKINFRASMESHLESIKSFYDYLRENGKANDIFTQINYENYKNEIFDYCDLEEGSERKIFSTDTIKEILVKLDSDLERNSEQLIKKRESERYYQRQVLRLFIKLTLIAPAKKSVICNLQFSDFSEDYRTFTINKTTIRIPNGLRNNLLVAINLAQNINNKKPQKNDKVLHYVYKGNFSNTALNYWFCTFLKEYCILDIDKTKDTYELEPIMKSAIKFMVERMANPAAISKISGIKIATLESTYYTNIENFHYTETIDDTINWEIAKNDYYIYI